MNYYEELGVSQEATGEEIRKAHRRLVKLMHPDAQLDQSLKGLAETQMRRLNSIVSTLLDADQRRAYDDQLRNESLSPQQNQSRRGWRGVPWWFASVGGAVVLTLVAVWVWADHLSSNFSKSNHTIYVRPDPPPPVAERLPPPVVATPDPTLTAKIGDSHSDFPPAPDSHSSVDPHDASNGISATVVPPDSHGEITSPATTTVIVPPTVTPAPAPKVVPPPIAKKAAVVPPTVTHPDASTSAHQAAVQTPKPVTAATRKPVDKPVPDKPKAFNPAGLVASAHSKDVRQSGGQMLPPPGLSSSSIQSHADDGGMAMAGSPLPLALAPKPDPVNVPASTSHSGAGGRRDPLEGEWIYAPKEPERRKPGFYPPEFIDLKLFTSGDPGNLHGQYNARYVITDKPISPEVSFQFASVDKDSHKFVWQSSTGAKGTVAIHPVDDNTIRIEWRTTSSSRAPALTSGAATLVRRQ